MSDEKPPSEFTNQEAGEPAAEDGLREDKFLTLPTGWDVSTLSEVAEEEGLVDGDWIESDDMDDDGDIQLVQLSHIGEGQFRGKPDRFITQEFAQEEDCTLLSEGDLLISRMQEPILRSCLLPSFDRGSVMAVDIARLRETEQCNRQFLKYVLNSRPIWKQGIAWASGTTRKRISRKNMKKVRLPTPPLPEQRKIATVLHTVDRLIEKTRSVVDQSQKVEEAVRRQILLGNHQEGSTKSERLGPKRIMIPKGWSVRKIDEISDIKNGNRIVKGHDYSDSPTDYPFIRIKDMENGTVSIDNIRYLKEDTANQMNRGIIHSDEVYITVTGRVGDAGTIPEELDGARFTDNAAKLYNLNGIIPDYLSIYLRSKFGQDEVHRFTVGSTQPKLSMYRVEKMEVIIPPLEQQQDIVAKIRSVRSITDSNKKVLEIATRIKQGLMQDLLSGEVRTTDKSIEVPDEISQHG